MWEMLRENKVTMAFDEKFYLSDNPESLLDMSYEEIMAIDVSDKKVSPQQIDIEEYCE